VVCRLCGFVVNIKMARLHILERHPAVPAGSGFKCAYCGRVEASANDLVDGCRDGDKCRILRYKRRLLDAQSSLETELLKAGLRLRLGALKTGCGKSTLKTSTASGVAQSIISRMASAQTATAPRFSMSWLRETLEI
jgi:hypothetical protein